MNKFKVGDKVLDKETGDSAIVISVCHVASPYYRVRWLTGDQVGTRIYIDEDMVMPIEGYTSMDIYNLKQDICDLKEKVKDIQDCVNIFKVMNVLFLALAVIHFFQHQ